MKFILLFFSLSLFAGEKLPVILNDNLDSAGTAQQLSASSILVSSFLCCAAGTNAGTLYFADSSSNADAGKSIHLAAGQCVNFERDPDPQSVSKENGKTDLDEYWFDGDTTNDDIMCFYYL